MPFVAMKMGRRQGARRGASRTIFALGGEAQISRTAKMVRDARRYRQSGSDRLEKRPTDLRRKTCCFGDRTPASVGLDSDAKLP